MGAFKLAGELCLHPWFLWTHADRANGMAVKRATCVPLLGSISGLWQVLSLMGPVLCLDDQSEEQLFVRVGRAGRWARAGFKWMSAVAVIAWIVGSWVAVQTG